MAFKPHTRSGCKYTVRYSCDCRKTSSKNQFPTSPLALTVSISNHETIVDMQFFLAGKAANVEFVKYCPGCGITAPTPEMILVQEQLNHTHEILPSDSDNSDTKESEAPF